MQQDGQSSIVKAIVIDGPLSYNIHTPQSDVQTY
jgi:hypothetical protein